MDNTDSKFNDNISLFGFVQTDTPNVYNHPDIGSETRFDLTGKSLSDVAFIIFKFGLVTGVEYQQQQLQKLIGIGQ